MSESFDTYNAPQFFDFINDLKKEENTDVYFEVDHENITLEDPLKIEAEEESKESPVNYKNCENVIEINTLKDRNSEEIVIEEYIKSPVNSIPGDDECVAADRQVLRRSISVGNLHLLCEFEYQFKLEEVKQISSDLSDVYLYKSQKYPLRNESSKILKRTASNTCLQKSANLSRSSTLSQTRGSSRDLYDSLAQRTGSAQNLNHNTYTPMAEAVKKFPTSFRSKADLEITNAVSGKRTTTIPQSPALVSKQRHRPVNAISWEEQEKLEYEEAQKFKIKAHPLNKRILQGPLKPLMPIEKKPSTIQKPFNITAQPRKVVESPKKEVYEFHARPVPKALYEPPKLKEVQRAQPTNPQTPIFMKRYIREHVKPQEEQEKIKPSSKPRRTTPIVPFSFESRDQQMQKKKEEFVKKVLEEEKKGREFYAHPIPKGVLKSSKNSSLQRSDSTNAIRTKEFSKSEESLSNQFKARPPTVLYKKPFEPKKEERHLIEITEFQLNTEMRAKEREEFEQFKKEKEERIALTKQHEEQLRLQKEEEEIARIRKEAEYKAQPIKKYKEMKIHPSGKVTEPISPKFHTNRIRNKENKENSNENIQ